jgi:hypothetical protein
MTTVVAGCLLVWLAMAVGAGTPVGEAIRRTLVEKPAAWLAAIRRGQVAVFLLVFGGTGLVALALGHDAARGFAMVLPELAGWSTMIEVSLWVDAVVTVVTAVTTGRIGAVRTWVSARLPRRRARVARTRSRRPRPSTAANDDDPAFATALAA